MHDTHLGESSTNHSAASLVVGTSDMLAGLFEFSTHDNEAELTSNLRLLFGSRKRMFVSCADLHQVAQNKFGIREAPHAKSNGDKQTVQLLGETAG